MGADSSVRLILYFLMSSIAQKDVSVCTVGQRVTNEMLRRLTPRATMQSQL